MHIPRVYFNNIGLICTDSLRHGNGLSALLLLTCAAKSMARQKAARLNTLHGKRAKSVHADTSGDTGKQKRIDKLAEIH